MKGEKKKLWKKSKWSLFASLAFSSGFSEGAQKLAISIQQGGGRQRPYKAWGTHCWLLVEMQSKTFLSPLPCVHCEMSRWNDVSNYASFCLSMFVPVFLQILSGECTDIIGVLRSSVFCFHWKAVPLPPWISWVPMGGGFLPHPLSLVDIYRLQILLAWCCVLQQQQPWLFSAAPSVASWCCLPWGIISRVEAIFFPRNRKRWREWEVGGLNNLELDYSVSSMTSAPFGLPTHLLSQSISV